MLLKLELINSNNYCKSYLTNLIDFYFKKFIVDDNNLLLEDQLYINEYKLKIMNENKNYIYEFAQKIEKHIKNIYPDCGSNWKLIPTIK